MCASMNMRDGAESLLSDGDAEERGQAGGGRQDTGALEHRDNRRHLQARQHGGDARGAREVRAHERWPLA